MPEKIIFLDFDGPLSNPRVAKQTGSMKSFDPAGVGVLNEICRVSGAKIVCTSSRAALAKADSFQETCRYFEEAGLDLKHLHPDWSCRYDFGLREGHIQKWLETHPGVTHHVIIDDSLVELPNFIQVDSCEGISLGDFEKAGGILGVDMQAILKLPVGKGLNNPAP